MVQWPIVLFFSTHFYIMLTIVDCIDHIYNIQCTVNTINYNVLLAATVSVRPIIHAVIQSAEQCLKSCRYRSWASVNVHINIQNVIQVNFTMAWFLRSDAHLVHDRRRRWMPQRLAQRYGHLNKNSLPPWEAVMRTTSNLEANVAESGKPHQLPLLSVKNRNLMLQWAQDHLKMRKMLSDLMN